MREESTHWLFKGSLTRKRPKVFSQNCKLSSAEETHCFQCNLQAAEARNVCDKMSPCQEVKRLKTSSWNVTDSKGWPLCTNPVQVSGVLL